MITDYSAKISFTGNSAQCGVGHHMYGASVRGATCDKKYIGLANEQGKPHCWLQDQEADGYVNISFDPGLNETLSPVSSAPQRVCVSVTPMVNHSVLISHIFSLNQCLSW